MTFEHGFYQNKPHQLRQRFDVTDLQTIELFGMAITNNSPSRGFCVIDDLKNTGDWKEDLSDLSA